MPSKKKGAKKRTIKRKIDGTTKILAFVGVFIPLIGYLINLIIKHDDDYVMYYSKQGLVLFIFGLVLQLIILLFDLIIISLSFLGDLVWILLIVIWIIGWINALSGEKRSTIIIGDLVEKLGI